MNQEVEAICRIRGPCGAWEDSARLVIGAPTESETLVVLRADRFIPFCNNAMVTSLTLDEVIIIFQFEEQFRGNIETSNDYKHAKWLF